jgi:hypothetical protein
VSTIEELLGRKCSGSCVESREYGRRDPSRWPRGSLYPQRLALTSPASGGRSVGIVRSRTKATEFSFWYIITIHYLPFFAIIVLVLWLPFIFQLASSVPTVHTSTFRFCYDRYN